MRALVSPDPLQIRSAASIYLLLKGPNFFFAPQYQGTTSSVPSSLYSRIEARIGQPLTVFQSRLGLGSPEGYRLYWRTFQNGTVYANWTGQTQTLSLPTDRSYFDADGNAVTKITVPDLTATFVAATP